MNGQFHKALQSDIVDAVKYATSASAAGDTDSEFDIPPRPWGDLKQLAILGASFGVSLTLICQNKFLYDCYLSYLTFLFNIYHTSAFQLLGLFSIVADDI